MMVALTAWGGVASAGSTTLNAPVIGTFAVTSTSITVVLISDPDATSSILQLYSAADVAEGAPVACASTLTCAFNSLTPGTGYYVGVASSASGYTTSPVTMSILFTTTPTSTTPPSSPPATTTTSEGTWLRVSVPSGLSTKGLNAITCPSSTLCWAVGDSGVVARWNGTTWSVVEGGNLKGGLYGVACASTSSCWAVGYVEIGSSLDNAIEHWNGHSWGRVASPSPYMSGEGDDLIAVACATPAVCYAVGFTGAATSVEHPVVLRLSGSHWINVSVPNGANDTLDAVACPSATLCWALGSPNVAHAAAVMLRMTGSTWRSVADPTTTVGFTAVDCESVSYCVASGGDTGMMIWKGVSWSSVPVTGSPVGNCGSTSCATSINGDVVGYSGVACMAQNNCVVVGQVNPLNPASGSASEPWSMYFSGTSFIGIRPIASSGRYAGFSAVDCPTSTQCLAVGLDLIERFTP
ncbi:MAG: hypothetical protein ACRDVC_00475 [Acidimicrobiales bacterium]